MALLKGDGCVGLALEPLHSMAPQAALADPRAVAAAWHWSTRFEAMTAPRVSQLAAKLLRERIGS